MNGFPLTIRKLPSGESFWIHVDPNYRVSTCKQKIQRMRGIPPSNIRLSIPKGEADNETTISLTKDDYQQRTLASLGLVGSVSDTESVNSSNGPTLELSPMTVYVQTPSGRRIKLKESLDVEATVDTLEEIVTKELESANLLEASDSSKERFRLYHDRIPVRRGNKITRYKIKHLDVLKLKFGTGEDDTNQKLERRKAYEKLERKKEERKKESMRKSESAGNLRRLAKSKNTRTSSSSPSRSRRARSSTPKGQRSSTPKKQRPSTPKKQRSVERTSCPSSEGNNSSHRRNGLKKSPSGELLKRLSQSLTNIRTSSFSPIRGLARNNSCSSEAKAEKEQGSKRRIIKTRRDSSPAIGASPRRSSPTASPRCSSTGRLARRNTKTKTEERSSSQRRRRSRSNNTEGRKISRSKSRSARGDKARKMKKERRSRSAGKYGARDETGDLKKSKVRSRSGSRGSQERSARDKSDKSENSNSRRSLSGQRKNSCHRRIVNDEANDTTEEVKPRKPWKRTSSAKSLLLYPLSKKSDANEANASIEERKPRNSWKRPSSVQNLEADGIPDAFKLAMYKAPKKADAANEKSTSPSSPVCVLSETVNTSQIVEITSQKSSDIQSEEIKASVYEEWTDDKLAEPKGREVPTKAKSQDISPRTTNSIVERAKTKFEENSPTTEPKKQLKNLRNQSANNLAVSEAKTKFEKENSSPREEGKKYHSSTRSMPTKSEGQSSEYTSTGDTAKEIGTERTLKEGNSAVRSAKSKFEKESSPKIRLSIGKRNSDAESGEVGNETKSRTSIIKPLRPSLKDTQRRYSGDGGTVAKAAAEALEELDKSVVDEIKEEEKSTTNSSATDKSTKKPLQSASRDAPRTYSPESSIKDRIGKFESGSIGSMSPESVNGRKGKFQAGEKDNSDTKSVGSIKDRIGKFQRRGKENTNARSSESRKERPEKLQAGGKENAILPDTIRARNGKNQPSGKENNGAKSRGCIKERIGKFQSGGNTTANAGGFQMIGLATLGLKNTMTLNSDKKDDIDRSQSTTYSFFCSNDEMSAYESSDLSDSDFEYGDDSDSDDEVESIHVIGPDLTPFEIPLDSDSETVGDIKGAVAKAAGIPLNELRLGLQNEDSDLEESLRTNLDDNFKLSPGDILAVQPSTVVVKLPDGGSKLELSVFPGTLLCDIKDYIAKSTGTDPSRQLLYNFDKNFDEELEDDKPMTTDCTLRLTVY